MPGKLCVLGIAVIVLAVFVQADIVPDLVLGKGLLNSGVLTGSDGVAIDPNSEALFVADTLHNRVLRYENRCTLNSSSSPSVIFGQPNLNSTYENGGANQTTNQYGLSAPGGIAVDAQGTLWVADW